MYDGERSVHAAEKRANKEAHALRDRGELPIDGSNEPTGRQDEPEPTVLTSGGRRGERGRGSRSTGSSLARIFRLLRILHILVDVRFGGADVVKISGHSEKAENIGGVEN